MGRKYIIEIEDDRNIIETFSGKCTLAVPTRLGNAEGFINTNIPVTPYTEPDLEQVRKEGYDNGFEAGREYCPGQLSCMDATYQKGFRDGTKQCANCEEFKESAKAEAYQRGLADAWKVARKIILPSKRGGFTVGGFVSSFGTDVSKYDVMEKYSAQEAIEEIRAYEQAQEEIRAKEICAADVVQNKKDPCIKVFVTTVNDGKFSGVALTTVAGHCNRGNMFSYQDAECWEKVSGDWWRCLNEDDSE